MEAVNNAKDGFPEHDMKTILGYDRDALVKEIADINMNIMRIQDKLEKLQAEKTALLKEHAPKKNANRIKSINFYVKSFTTEISRLRNYKTRLLGYVHTIENQ